MRLQDSQFLRMQRYGQRMRNSFQKTDKLVRFAESIKRISTYSTKHSNLSLYLLILGRRRLPIAEALGRNIQNIMNWIILIIAGLCEVGFTYCLEEPDQLKDWNRRSGNCSGGYIHLQ